MDVLNDYSDSKFIKIDVVTLNNIDIYPLINVLGDYEMDVVTINNVGNLTLINVLRI